MIEWRLLDDAGVRLQELDHEAVVDVAFVVQAVEQGVMPERCMTFIHHLRLALRVEILSNFPNNAHDFALPRLQQRRIFLDEVQQIFLRLGRVAFRLFGSGFGGLDRDGAPQIVDLRLQVFLPLVLALLFLA